MNKTKNGFSSVLIFILVLGVFLIAGGSYYFGTQKKYVITPEPVGEQENIFNNEGNDQNANVSPFVAITSAPVPTVDETAVLKVAIKKSLVLKHGNSANELNITVSKVEGNYASGGASVPGQGGGMWFSAKVNGTWQLAWDGNGVILCTDLTAYPNFPSSMIPECYNEKTNKTVVR